MKKIFIVLSVLFLMTTNCAQAISIDNRSDSMIINGVNIYKSDIKKVEYSSPDEATEICMRSGQVVAFYSSFDDYRQIKSAFNTKSYVVGRSYYLIPYYGSYYSTSGTNNANSNNSNSVSHI